MRMTDRIRAFAAVAVAGLCLAGAARAEVSPKALVRTLYNRASISMDASGLDGFLTTDLAQAMRADSRPGEVGAIDFDYRYGAQDLRISGLNILEVIDNNEAQVVAVFKNFNRPHSVNWKLCRRASGEWRIYDAWSNTGEEWDLRQMLRLPPRPGHC
jgi:hypothetical protein